MLTVVNTVVETTMYLWVALWVPSLQDTLSEGDAPLPLGRVFSSFMAAMSLGSLVYNAVLYRYGPNTKPKATDVQPAPADEHQSLLARTTPLAGAATGPVSQAVVFHARLGSGLLVLSGVANVLSAFTGSTRTRFLCFLVFEGSLGLYCQSQVYSLDMMTTAGGLTCFWWRRRPRRRQPARGPHPRLVPRHRTLAPAPLP